MLAVLVAYFLVKPSKPKTSIEFASNNVITATSAVNQSPVTSNSIVIDISGAVNSPGVYSLPEGSRLTDAIQMAGSFSAQVSWEYIHRSLNLAKPIKDSDKIYIPFAGEAPDNSANVSESLSSISASPDSTTKSSLMDINSASLKELDSLPGIGATRAQAIIDGRPYQKVQELLDRKILSKNVYEEIKEKLVTSD